MHQKISAYLLLVISFVVISCSEDDSNSQNPQNENNYFPLVVNNSWDYENTVSAPGQSDFQSQETLSVSNSSQAGANTIFEFETTNPVNSAPTTLALSNGVLYKNGGSLIYTGSFGLGIPDFPDLSFEIEDGVIYNKNADEGSELFSFSNTIQESIQGFPITIDYTISSIMDSTFESLTVNNQAYQDVISSRLVVNIEISPNGIGFSLLEDSEVVVVTNFFAKDIGLIKSETDTDFDFIAFGSIPLEDFSFFTLQELVSYDVNIE